jgi:hypothetical protein
VYVTVIVASEVGWTVSVGGTPLFDDTAELVLEMVVRTDGNPEVLVGDAKLGTVPCPQELPATGATV